MIVFYFLNDYENDIIKILFLLVIRIFNSFDVSHSLQFNYAITHLLFSIIGEEVIKTFQSVKIKIKKKKKQKKKKKKKKKKKNNDLKNFNINSPTFFFSFFLSSFFLFIQFNFLFSSFFFILLFLLLTNPHLHLFKFCC